MISIDVNPDLGLDVTLIVRIIGLGLRYNGSDIAAVSFVPLCFLSCKLWS